MKRQLFAIAFLCAALSACSGISLVEAGKPVSMGDGIEVDPQIRWTKLPAPSGTLWTQDGMGLNELRFYVDVRAGRSLMSIPGQAARDLPHYQSSMLPDDVMELTASTLTRGGYVQVRASGLRPASFGSGRGFRFDLDFVADGLVMKGMAIARQHSGHLDLILFVAPGEFYFGRDQALVEKVFSGIRAPA